MGVGGEVEGAKRVTLACHIFPQKVSRPVNLQVSLQIWLLLKTMDDKCEVLRLVGCVRHFLGTFIVAISKSCSCFSWSMWKLDCTCLINSTPFT